MPEVCILSSQNLDREAWLGHCHNGYLELDREQPFFDALGDFRTHIAKCEEHVTTALSEVRILSLEPESISSIWQRHFSARACAVCASCVYMVLSKHAFLQITMASCE